MNSECTRIADQLRRALNGDPWHGPSLRGLLADITAEQALARPLRSGHSIWELVLHIDLYGRIAFEAIRGTPMPKLFGTGEDWPAPGKDKLAWTAARDRLFEHGEQLARAIEGLSDARLHEQAPGRDYDLYFLFHGIVQHHLYHGGQIALLKKT